MKINTSRPEALNQQRLDAREALDQSMMYRADDEFEYRRRQLLLLEAIARSLAVISEGVR